MNKNSLALAIAIALSSASVSAEESNSSVITYLGGGLEYIDKDLNLEKRRQEYIEFGLGYAITPHWEYMFRGGYADSYFSDYSLDLNYTISPEESWQPMLKLGVGQAAYGEDEHDYLALGVGVKTMLAEHWDFRMGVARHFGDYSRQDDVFTLGFTYYFSGRSSAGSQNDAYQEPVPAASADSDNDGVMNEYDRCPNTPAGESVDSLGCTLAAPVVEEPVSPEAPEVKQENPDQDNDGVLDVNDSCLNTPAGTEVGADGCGKVAVELAEMTLSIKFATNSSEIATSYQKELLELAKLVEKYPNAMVQVEGHTDSMGAAKYNKWLSERRAKSVKQYLMQQLDLEESKVLAYGFGEEQPIASNDTNEGRAQNRRVVAKIVYR